MAEFRQYYAVLGLEPGASQEAIKQAYRQLAKAWHPDRFAHEPDLKHLAEEKIKTINEAYQKLKQVAPEQAVSSNSSASSQPASTASAQPAPAETVIRRKAASAERFYQEAAEHVQARRYREAIESLGAAIRVNPEYIQAYRYRGFVYSLMGLELSAEADLAKAKQLERSQKIAQPQSAPCPTPPPAPHPQSSIPRTPSHPWRCTQTLLGHPSGVNAIALAPDNRILATAGNDALVQLWNLKTGKAFCQLNAHRQAVCALAFSPNGQILVSGGADRTLKLWHLQSASLLRSLVGHTGCVTAVGISRDRQTILSGSTDGTLQCWNLSSGQLVRTLTTTTDRIRAIALTPDGLNVISVGDEHTISIFAQRTGELLRKWSAHPSPILAVAFHPASQRIAIGTQDGTLQLWTLQGKLLLTCKVASEIRAIAFNPAGNLLASGGRNQHISLWAVAQGSDSAEMLCQPLQTLTDHSNTVTSLRFSTSGQTLLSGSLDGTVKLWRQDSQ